MPQSQSADSYVEIKRKAMQAFLFDENDLSVNHEGKLSDKQIRRFISSTRKAVVTFVLTGLILSVMFIWSLEKPLSRLVLAIPTLFVMSFAIIALYVYWLGSKVYKSGVVKYVVGMATFRNSYREKFLQVGGEYFRSNRKFREIFVPDVQYKIYYAPSDNTIVSVEIVDYDNLITWRQAKKRRRYRRVGHAPATAGGEGILPSLVHESIQGAGDIIKKTSEIFKISEVYEGKAS